MAIDILYAVLFVFGIRAAAFNLYPTVNPDSLSKILGISIDCLDALNETVSCDQTLFQMSNQVDTYLWTPENVKDLCTEDCVQSSQKWWSDVQNRCAADTISAYGKMIPVESIPGRFSDGLSLACLKSGPSSSAPGLSSNSSSSSTGSAPYSNSSSSAPGLSSNSSSSSTGSAPYSNSSSNPNSNSSASSWCLIESQDWVGSDIIRPDCSTDSTDPSCSDPTDVAPENERIANLYDHDMLCSDCFIKMFYQRMSSPYLPDSNYSDYLVAQYQDILDVCDASMPELVVRALPSYEDAPGMYDGMPFASPDDSLMASFSSNGTQFSNGTNSTSTCSGQTICAADLNDLNVPANGASCDALSAKSSVTTGDLQVAIGDPHCIFLASSYCVPPPCTLTKVPSGATCDSIVRSLSKNGSNNSNPITTVHFMNWNPNINGLCSSLTAGDFVCTGAPGGSYIPPPISITRQNATALERGGDDGGIPVAPYSNSTNTTAPPPSISSGSGSPAPSPTQPGIAATCTKYGQAQKGDYCFTFAQDHSITLPQLYALNAALGSTGQNCNTAFWSGYYYCVDAMNGGGGGDNSTALAMSTVVSTNMDSSPTGPTPLSTIMSTVVSSVMSTVVASVACTSTSVPVITADNTPSSTPSPTQSDIASPSPTQSGIASPCAKYAQAHAGDTCASFAAANGITVADLYGRNGGALGDNGQGCATGFWGGYYYCVGGTD